MALRGMARRLLQSAARVPGLRQASQAYYTRQFRNWPGACRGVFGSFAEAVASSPAEARVGYDHDEFGTIYDDRLFRVFPADYPVMFWLARIAMKDARVFDFGGHVGLAFYGFERYLGFTATTVWTLYDVPKVIEAAKALALQHPRPQLHFSTDLADLAGHDVFHASGALQYLEKPLAEQLVERNAFPRHLVINKLPLTDGPSFATLQNTFHAFNPYAVFNRAGFVAGLERLGYELVDSWTNPDFACAILDQPERSVSAYSGLYLRRRAA
jgi:putative methyltransferase (TIGR04325 family)